jgi:hypothetical protein
VNRQTLQVAVVAVLAVVAIGFAAGTLDTTVGTGDGGGGLFDFGDPPNASGEGAADQPDDLNSEGGGSLGNEITAAFCIPFLQSPLFLGGVVLAVIAGGVYARRRGVEPTILVALGAGLLPLFGVLYVIFSSCSVGSFSQTQLPSPNVTEVVDAVSGATGSASSAPTIVLGVLVLAVVLLGAVLFRQSGGGEAGIEAEDEGESEESLEAIGAAAGEAADRIEEDAAVDNEVYRAWQEMTTSLDVDRPEASTPGEFADAAVGAGMDEADVAELTGLFEDVRYGDADATADRERRAVEALRRIEDAYADAEADADADDDGDAAPDRDGGGQ